MCKTSIYQKVAKDRYTENQFNIWPQINQENLHKFPKIKYKWPFEYTNLIIFGEGIKKSDIKWQDANTLLNEKTGDKITFKGKPCFSFVYSDGLNVETLISDKQPPQVSDVRIKEKVITPVSNESESKEVNVTSKNKNLSYKNIPEYFQKTYLRKNMKREYHRNRLISTYRRLVKGGESINPALVALKQEEMINSSRMMQRIRILRYDKIFDGVVTFKEVEETLEPGNRAANVERIPSRQIQLFQQYDLNHDEIITNDEMVTLNEKITLQMRKNVEKKYQPLKEIDLNHDGMVTLNEFTETGDIIDVNADETISNEEILQFKNYMKDRSNLKKREKQKSINVSLNDNVKINKTMMEIKRIDAAVSTFRDMYDAHPGDMATAFTRLPNCTAKNCGNGDGNATVGISKLAPIELLKDERHLFWIHLNKASLLSGYYTGSNIQELESAYPISAMGGVYQVYFHDGKNLLPYSFKGSKAKNGLYILLTNDASGDMKDGKAHFLTSNQAAQLDRKLDDGNPLTGTVIAAGHDDCLKKSGAQLIYANDNQACLSLYVKIH